MSESPPAPDSPPSADSEPSGVDLPGTGTPYLLVMPSVDGAPPTMTWPGPEGRPGWAIPVTIPAGTRGYAVFVPLLPADTTLPTGVRPAVALPAETTAASTTTVSTATGTPVAETAPADVSAATPASAPSPSTEAPPASASTEAEVAAEPSAGTPAEATSSGTPSPGTRSPGSPTGTPSTGTPTATPSTSTATGAPASGAPGQTAGSGHTSTPGPAWQGAPGFTPARPYHMPLGPPRPSFLQTRWPGPAPGRGWAVPAAVLVGALGHAFFVPLNRTGIGWLLGWLTLTIGVVLAVRGNAGALPRTERWVRAGWAAAALALLAVLAFRNAWWLVTFCVLGALGCATLAIIGGRLVRSILFSLVAAPFAAFRGLPWVRRHVRTSASPTAARRIVGSAAATLAVLLVFGALLSSADAAFSVVLGELVPEVNVGTVFKWLFLLAVGGLTAVAAVYTLAAPPDLSTVDKPSDRRFSVLEWAPAIAALTLLFGGFVAVQFTVLFGGQRHVLETAGLSYAEYARSGFWQLVVVTLLTLAILGGVTRWARRDRPVERVLLRVLLGLLSALSVVIVVSALSRMYTYQEVYSFTGERIFVMAFELLLGAVFLMILAAGIRWRGGWIPRVTVGLVVLMLLGLAGLNPEAYAARRNIARYQETGKIDAWYLRALSADATPALATLPDPVRRCTLSWIDEELAEPDPWYAWNLGRIRARQALDRLGPNAVGGPKDCRAADQFDLPKIRR
ncbi:DUF4153 domain-containing protein [Plantactinospora sonchi]|uniref:DUF4153 domain-containing protein n=1 Tax=Plantactinospora sonchi TaxID=1544735 RepID=A0ABU7S3X1_9ACTN